MLNYDPGSPLFSIHVPKTGGTSLRSVLKKWFGRDLLFHYYNEKLNIAPTYHPNLTRRRFWIFGRQHGKCIHGHFSLNRQTAIKDYYSTEKVQCISVMRDPLEIAISNYYFFKKKELENGKVYRSGHDHFLNGKDISSYIRKANSFLTHFMPVEVTESNYLDIINESFIHIGVIEKYQESINTIGAKLGKPVIKVDSENQSKRGEYPESGAIDEFRNRNKLSYLIYDYAVDLNSKP